MYCFQNPLTKLFSIGLVFCSSTLFASSQPVAPPLQLAKIYQQDIDLSEYWLSEKLDGVRAFWNGEKLLTRRGNSINAPAWFISLLPDTPLDGELWISRNQFAAVSGIVRKNQPVDSDWQSVKFMVFDLPASLKTFDHRINDLSKIIAQIDSSHVQMVEQVRAQNQSQIDQMLDGIIALKGEGLMLRKGNSSYQAKRTDDLLKIKPFEDAEARVLAHLPGKGQFSGVLGALLVELSDGRQMKIGTGFSYNVRKNPPPIGSLITYRFRGRTKNNLPRFASFLRLRDEF